MTSLLSFVTRSLLVICVFLCPFLSPAQQSLGYVWGRSISGSGYLNLEYSVADANGNVYLAGVFDSQIDMDPSPNASIFFTAGGTDGFVSKLNTNGELVWAIQLGSTGIDRVEYIQTDAQGNVYVTGSFSGTVDFDPGAGTAALTAPAGTHTFVAKYNSMGEYGWAVSFEGTGNSTGKALAVGSNENVFVTGNFAGTLSFSDTVAYTSQGGNDVFVCQLNAGGQFVWGRQIGGSSADNAAGIVADASGNVFASGAFENGIIDLDPGTGTASYSAATSNIYLVKLNTVGDFVWGIRNFAQTVGDVAIDANGNVLLVGTVAGIVDFDPGTGVANAGTPRTFNHYVWKLTGDGAYVMAKAYYGLSSPQSVNLDAAGAIYTGGGLATFNKRTSNGNLVWSHDYGVTGNECKMLAVDALQQIYVTGNFHAPIDLDPGVDTALFFAGGTYGIFISKLTELVNGPLPLTWIKLDGALNNRQQATISFTVNEEEVDHYTIEKSADGIAFTTAAYMQSKGNGINSYTYTEAAVLQQSAWYRVQQTDKDQRTGYSTLVRVNNDQARMIATVYPVPAIDQVTLHIATDDLLHTEATLLNLQGHVIKRLRINDYNTPVSLHNLPCGLYMLQLANGVSLKVLHR